MNSNNTRTLFVSTAIPFVNAAPHLGFALEVILADAIARNARSRGNEVRFTSGTDDHSLKNVRAAALLGQSTRRFVDDAAKRYLALQETLGAQYDDFIRTSHDPRHIHAVSDLWSRCERAGDLYRRQYRGLYCVGCEQFFEPADLEASNGLCPEHDVAPEVVEEDNWFFRLSRYEDQLRALLTDNPSENPNARKLRVWPPSAKTELLKLIDSGLHDISVSRSPARAGDWGIRVPASANEEATGQVIYVWFDALANYLASADAWSAASRRVHVIGKGITRFHAVLWPAILLSAELDLPTDLVVHGYLTVEGRKIGKSLGNAIDPARIVEAHGLEALRWFLLRHIGPVNDGDFTEARLKVVHDSELADGLGNLLSRTIALVRASTLTNEELLATATTTSCELTSRAFELEAVVNEAFDRFAPHDAARAIAALWSGANEHLARTEPWSLAKQPEKQAQYRDSLASTWKALDAIAHSLQALLPDTAARIKAALADPNRSPVVLFPKVKREG